jgi:hypothetical protein
MLAAVLGWAVTFLALWIVVGQTVATMERAGAVRVHSDRSLSSEETLATLGRAQSEVRKRSHAEKVKPVETAGPDAPPRALPLLTRAESGSRSRSLGALASIERCGTCQPRAPPPLA